MAQGLPLSYKQNPGTSFVLVANTPLVVFSDVAAPQGLEKIAAYFNITTLPNAAGVILQVATVDPGSGKSIVLAASLARTTVHAAADAPIAVFAGQGMPTSAAAATGASDPRPLGDKVQVRLLSTAGQTVVGSLGVVMA